MIATGSPVARAIGSSRLASEAILNDFVRISDESRTSMAVVDPTAGRLTEIYEWGPAVRPDELETLLDKLRYLSRVASYVVFSGSLPRDVEDDFYAEAIRDLTRRGVQCVLDCEGEPLRIGVEAEPFLVSPNQREAESLVGQEFSDDEDFVMALEAIADLGARNVLITQETSCFGLFHGTAGFAAGVGCAHRPDRSCRCRRCALAGSYGA